MQFLAKHNGLKGFLEEGDNLQEEVDHTNATRDRKHHAVPTHMRSNWQGKPHQLLSLSVDQPLLVPLIAEKGINICRSKA